MQLQQTSKDLEIEKIKTEHLLLEMLPRQVAENLKEGKSVEAGEIYNTVKIIVQYKCRVQITDKMCLQTASS